MSIQQSPINCMSGLAGAGAVTFRAIICENATTGAGCKHGRLHENMHNASTVCIYWQTVPKPIPATPATPDHICACTYAHVE